MFGDLSDVSFPDVLRILRAKTGTLYLYSALGGRSLELGLNQNHLLSMFIDGFPMSEKMRAVDIITQLLQGSGGKFTFEAVAPEKMTRHYLIPLYPIILEVSAQQAVQDADLPHPQTLFRVAESRSEVPAVLFDTWLKALPYLKAGTSGEQLGQGLNLPLREALVLLSRFRAASLIELTPHLTTATPAEIRNGSVPAVVTRETQSLLQRFILRLRGQAAS